MNDFQQKVWEYLTLAGGTSERRIALKDLVERDFFFGSDLERNSKKFFDTYLAENKRGFCLDGLQRARAALLPKGRTLTVVVEVDVEAINGAPIAVGEYTPGPHTTTGESIRNALNGTKIDDLSGSQRRVAAARVISIDGYTY